MTNPRSHVRPGDKLALAASQVNFLNKLMDADTSMLADPLKGWGFGGNVVMVKNTSGGTVNRWGVLAISGIRINPNDGDKQRRGYEAMPCLLGQTPTSDTDKFVIAVEPIKNNAIGRAAIAGVTPAKLVGGANESPFAKPKANNKAALEAGNGGPARILWRDDDWGLVRIGDAGPIRICKTGSQWPLGGVQELEVYEDHNNYPLTSPDKTLPVETLSAFNFLYPVAADSYVFVEKIRGHWYLVSAGIPPVVSTSGGACWPVNIGGHDLTGLNGYNGATTQVLGHVNGCLQWFNTQECPPPSPGGGE